MHIDVHDRRLRIAAGAVGFVALVAWLVPPTTPQSQPSPLRAFATIDPHRDDAGAMKRDQRTTVWSADAWKRWYAGEARAPAPPPAYVPPMPAPVVQRPAAPPRIERRRERIEADDRWTDEDWEEREADRRRWIEADREARREERRWEREQARRDREEYRAWERREREMDRRMRRYPDDDPAYDGE